MDSLLNHLRAQASQLDHGWGHPRIGIVSSVDVRTYTVRVLVQPEGSLTGWLPVAAGWIGNGWGMVCAPIPGDQVIVLWQEGDAEQGVVVGRLFSKVAAPPSAPVGEFWLMHRNGTSIKLLNDGSISSAGGTWYHDGDFRVHGDVYDQHGSLSAFRKHYNQHTHPPSSAPPNPTD